MELLLSSYPLRRSLFEDKEIGKYSNVFCNLNLFMESGSSWRRVFMMNNNSALGPQSIWGRAIKTR